MKNKRILAVDIESYYSDDYSLAGKNGITMEHYIRNPEFEMQLVCCTDVATGEQFHWDPMDGTQESLYKMLDPENTIVVMHNMFFDGLALAFHYDIFFADYIDTSALARWGLGDMSTGKSYWTLKAVSEHFGLKEKDRGALEAVKGKHREEITGEQWDRFVEYCYDDSLITAQAFTKFMEGPCKRMRPEAFKVMSWTCKNWCNPRLKLDKAVLSEYAENVKKGRRDITKMLGTNAKELRSSAKLAAMLEKRCGIEVGTKTSPTTGKQTYAFAKDDSWMVWATKQPGLLGLLTRARTAFASNIGVTRADRMWGLANRGDATVALQFCGATNTSRCSATDKIQWMNMPKTLGTSPHPLRKSVSAPKGKVLVAADCSQAEVRFNALLAKQEDILDAFAAGRDIYCEFGSDLFGREITKDDGAERFFSKMCVLGMGYSMSANRFLDECLYNYGITDMTLQKAKEAVNFYRSKYSCISQNWWDFDKASDAMASNVPITLGRGLKVTYDGGSSNELLMPTGFTMKFPRLRKVRDEDTGRVDWRYGAGKGYKIFGASYVEGVCQTAVSQFMEEKMAIILENGVDIVLQIHDEVIVLCDENIAHDMGKWLVEVLSTPAPWCPDIPLAAEYVVGKKWSDLK